MSDDSWPAVDVVMPVRNEAAHLGAAVAAIDAQDYPGELRLYLAVGPSNDGTEAVAARLAAEHRDLTVVPNPGGTTPAGLNAAIRRGAAPVVARADGHSRLSAGYLRGAVKTLCTTRAVNVGGVQLATGDTPMERAIAAAMSSRFGTGGARFHVGGLPGPVDTVYLGVFRREAIEAVGLFDESLLRNQDYELNFRLRQAGGTVWFDPSLSATYRPRPSLCALASQYFQYGQFKRRVVTMHPSSLKARQAIPPVACAAALTGLVAGLRWRRGLVAPIGYAVALAVAAVTESRRRGVGAGRLAAALTTIHFSWSAGFVRGSYAYAAEVQGRR